MVIIDNSAVISLTKIDYERGSSNIQINHINSFKLCYVVYDIKYIFSKKYLLGVIYEKDKGEIHKIDLYKRRYKKIIESEDKIYAIEVSLD